MKKSKVLTFKEFSDKNFFQPPLTYRGFPRYSNFQCFWSTRRRDTAEGDFDQSNYLEKFTREHPGLDTWLEHIFRDQPIRKDCPELFEIVLYQAYKIMMSYGASHDDLNFV